MLLLVINTRGVGEKPHGLLISLKFSPPRIRTLVAQTGKNYSSLKN